jgi:hypothetical protein
MLFSIGSAHSLPIGEFFLALARMNTSLLPPGSAAQSEAENGTGCSSRKIS